MLTQDSLDSIHPLIEYISRFDSSFPRQIKGATAETIDALEQTIGMQLPSVYRDFLEHMGADTAGLCVHSDAATDPETVIEYYNDHQDIGIGPPANCIVIGVYATSEPDLAMDIERPHRMLMTRDDQVKFAIADAFLKFLYHRAFLFFRTPLIGPKKIYLGTDTQQHLEFARELAIRLGFEPLWFSDSMNLCLEREGAAMYLNQDEGRSLFVRIHDEDQIRLEQTAAEFIRQFGVEYVP